MKKYIRFIGFFPFLISIISKLWISQTLKALKDKINKYKKVKNRKEYNNYYSFLKITFKFSINILNISDILKIIIANLSNHTPSIHLFLK